jgi:hypothetical protein
LLDAEDLVRRVGRTLADGIGTSDAFERIEERRNAATLSARSSATTAAMVFAVVVGVVAGSWGLARVFTRHVSGPVHRVTVVPPTDSAPSPSSLPTHVSGAGTIVAKYAFEPDWWVPAGGSVFGAFMPPDNGGNTATIGKIAPDGSITRRNLYLPGASGFLEIAATPDAVYVGGFDRLVRLDPTTLVQKVSVPMGTVNRITATGAGLWVALDERVLRLDPTTLQTLASVRLLHLPPSSNSGIKSPALGAGGLWVVTSADSLVRLDPLTLRVLSRTAVPFSDEVVANDRSVWLLDGASSSVQQVDPSGQLRGSPIHLDGLANGQAWEGGLVVLQQLGSSFDLVLIDPDGSVVGRTTVGDVGAWFTVDGRDAWLWQAGLMHVRLKPGGP